MQRVIDLHRDASEPARQRTSKARIEGIAGSVHGSGHGSEHVGNSFGQTEKQSRVLELVTGRL
jgi:hypothetical protein